MPTAQKAAYNIPSLLLTRKSIRSDAATTSYRHKHLAFKTHHRLSCHLRDNLWEVYRPIDSPESPTPLKSKKYFFAKCIVVFITPQTPLLPLQTRRKPRQKAKIRPTDLFGFTTFCLSRDSKRPQTTKTISSCNIYSNLLLNQRS